MLKMYTMKCILFIVVALTLMLTFGECRRRARSKMPYVSCRQRTAVRYQLTVHTTWTRQSFPKMYPVYRPPAQWSALIGNSHNSKFMLWKEGENATRGVRQFAETGDSNFLQQDISQGYDSVLDSFTAPAIRKGSGQTSTVIFADGYHTQISFMMKLVPSPDWFIGVSSLDLCRRGRWRPAVHLNLHPMDAGTDQGLTYTSPNWPSEPTEPIFEITAQYPNHEASSFHYPERKVLPRIAYIDLKLIGEYRLRRTVGDITDDRPSTATPPPPTRKPTTAAQSTSQPKETTPKPTTLKQTTKTTQSPPTTVTMTTTTITTKEYDQPIIEDQLPEINNDPTVKTDNKQTTPVMPKSQNDSKDSKKPQNDVAVTPTQRPSKKISSEFKMESLILKPQVFPTLRELKTSETFPTKPVTEISEHAVPAARLLSLKTGEGDKEQEFHPEDCIVSAWSEWSQCSKTCGFGKQIRVRHVIRFPLDIRGSCPQLRQETVCGSMRSCDWTHFSFLSRGRSRNQNGSSERRRRPRRTRSNRDL